MPVSGDFETTANFALVVRGVPTSGEKTNASGASGASGSTRGGARACISQGPGPGGRVVVRVVEVEHRAELRVVCGEHGVGTQLVLAEPPHAAALEQERRP